MGRCPSTISRELRRNRTDDEYFAAQAQREAERRRQERPLVRKMEDPEINEAVRAGLAQEWAPEQIEGRMQQQDCDRSRFVANDLHLDQAGRRPRALGIDAAASREASKPAERRATTGDAARIDNRPEVIEERLRLGDFEGDTVLGPARHGRPGDPRRSQGRGLRSSSRFNPRTPTMCMRKSNSV